MTASEPSTEERIGPFRVVRQLGTGGTAQTFLGERTGPGGVVERACVKRILPQLDRDPAWVSLLENEARVLATLRHPCIVALHELGRDGDTWWMALELVDGVDLRTLLDDARARGERLPPDVVAHIVIEIASALEYAHERSVIHRDVTPGNILIGRDGSVKLTDFGIAKTPQGERTRTGFVKGKAHYMAPEQILGAPDLDGRVDLFALGVVAFEMLAGQRPFRGKTELAVHRSIVAGNRARIRDLARESPDLLNDTIESLLAVDRNERAPSASTLLDALAPIAPSRSIKRRLGTHTARFR